MKVNEIKETREVVVRTEYVAEDGTKFYNKEECKKYEASALATVSRKLKRMTQRKISEYDIFERGYGDELVEIFDIKTQNDLDNLEKYLRLKLEKNGWEYTEGDMNPFTDINGKRSNYVFENVTYGHEVMIFWSEEEDWFYVLKDGSIEGMKQFFQERVEKLIKPEEKENEDGN